MRVFPTDAITIDASRFFACGRALLLWPADADQPTAFVTTAAGGFSVTLRDVPEGFRDVVNDGTYWATWSWTGCRVAEMEVECVG